MPGGLAQGRQVSGPLPLTSHFPYTEGLCKTSRAFFFSSHAGKSHLQMWDFSAVESLKKHPYFNKSFFPSFPPTDGMKAEVRPVSPMMAKQTCQSYGLNPGSDEPLLS